jgi:hypothetical protein
MTNYLRLELIEHVPKLNYGRNIREQAHGDKVNPMKKMILVYLRMIE